ncbi:uncharacterized protein LOC128999533 [Macrosteles quadrilineatus]|uniref:uncharacterized protein LOC128999533 n=1 Tax=Macrosteles quadrilineatus TaxID=74068 RepID=UPI0023E176F6|nr:uncharacterized protein LOC128999533 [Macrosteles quadrilineatus]
MFIMGESENISISLDTTLLRKQFIQGLNGSTMSDVIIFSSQFPLLTFVAVSFEFFTLKKLQLTSFKISNTPKSLYSSIFVYLLETLMIVLPVTAMFTFFSAYINIFFFVMVGLITAIVISCVSSVDDNVLYWKLTNLKQELMYKEISCKKQLYITYFRSFVLLVTAVSILGVDFHIFPRRFAKTETYGVSLMDIGVGMFVISNALVEKQTSGTFTWKKTVMSSLVLLSIGIMRCLLIQNLDYQMHVSEYGRHWNFFITLAFTKLLSTLFCITFRGHSLVTGIVLVLIHQYLLSHSLESFVFGNNDRKNWFTANIEGIVSLSGYLGLHMIGIAVGNFLNPRDKYLQTKHKMKAILIFSVTSVFLFFTLYYFESADIKVSRRLANLPYVLWITAISLELLVLFLLIEFTLYWLLPIEPQYRNKLYYILTPVVLEGINFNGLLFFLVSNLITGLINICIDTFSSSLWTSSFILLAYMFVDCAMVFFLYVFNIRLQW